MKTVVLKTLRGVRTSLGTVGSTFFRRESDGKYSVALAPIVLVGLLGVGLTCVIQEKEPFAQCFKANIDFLKEYIYAN